MLVMAGCAGLIGGDSSGQDQMASSDADSKSADESGGSTSQSGDSPGAVKQSLSTGPLNRDVISTGQITVSAESISKARAEVMGLVSSYNGTIADEQTDSDRRGRAMESTLTLRVPTSSFAEAMNGLARIGKVEHQTRKSEDVTTKVLDNEARVRAAERAIRQIEVLLGRANALRDIIAIESDLARRQADLDSLKSQEAWLEDQTSLSTINVHLSRPGAAPEEEARGFLAGLGERLGRDADHDRGAAHRGRGCPALRGAVGAGRRTGVDGPAPPGQRRECSCTKCVRRASWSGSVDGITPWPRLKM